MATQEQLAKYRARSREELLAITPTEKQCRICGLIRPGADFPLNRSLPDGRDRRCKPCAADLANAYRREHPDRVAVSRVKSNRKNYERTTRPYKLKRLYGLSREEYDSLFLAQEGICAICRKPETAIGRDGQTIRGLSVDHCHDTTMVRGLLCSRCNSAIGLLNHDADLLRAAINYLTEGCN